MMLSATISFLSLATACSGSPPAATQPTTHEVWYRADGDGTKTASYTLRSEDGGTVQGDINLPLTNQQGETGLTFTGFKSRDFVYLSVQNSSDAGSITCQIFVDGVQISSNTSDGAYKIATCQGRVP